MSRQFPSLFKKNQTHAAMLIVCFLHNTFANMPSRFIIDETMRKISKTTRASTPAPTPRFKLMWCVPDHGGFSTNEHVENIWVGTRV